MTPQHPRTRAPCAADKLRAPELLPRLVSGTNAFLPRPWLAALALVDGWYGRARLAPPASLARNFYPARRAAPRRGGTVEPVLHHPPPLHGTYTLPGERRHRTLNFYTAQRAVL